MTFNDQAFSYHIKILKSIAPSERGRGAMKARSMKAVPNLTEPSS